MDVKGAKNAALQLRNHVMSGGDTRGLLINEVRHFVVCIVWKCFYLFFNLHSMGRQTIIITNHVSINIIYQLTDHCIIVGYRGQGLYKRY